MLTFAISSFLVLPWYVVCGLCFSKSSSNVNYTFCKPYKNSKIRPISIHIMARERLESLSKQLIPSSFTPKPTTLSYCRKVIHLDRGWLFRQADGDQSAQTFRSTAMFPTNVHLDLLSHGLIPDPFVGMNEKEVQWVGEKTWVYKCSIQIPPQEIRKHRKAVMVFDGLDTFATVQLNGVEILRSSNMFQSHTVDVRYLMDGRERHSLEIVFKSATDIGHKEMNNHPEHKWGVWNGDPSRAAVRKAQYHYVRYSMLVSIRVID